MRTGSSTGWRDQRRVFAGEDISTPTLRCLMVWRRAVPDKITKV